MTDGDQPKNYATCGIRKRQGDRGPCTRPAGWGTQHAGEGPCKLHGGSLPYVTAKAERTRSMDQARDAIRGFTITPVENPYVELQKIAGELVAVKEWLRSEVERLQELRYQGRSGEQLRGELLAYQTALRDATTTLTAMARLNIDEKLIKIEEGKAKILITAINAALEEVGVTGQQAVQARQTVARHLRAVP